MTYKIKLAKKKESQGTYSNMRLMDNEGNEFSANPSDYFNMDNSKKFEGNALVVNEYKDGWMRVKVIKNNPTKEDLIKLNKQLKQHI